MRNYELVCIFDPNNSAAMTEDIKNIVTSQGAVVNEVEEWGSKRLAYEIDRHKDGYYVLYHMSAEPAVIKPLDHDLRLREDIIRFRIFSDQPVKLKVKVK